MILNAYSYNENKSDRLAHSIKTQTLYIDSVDNIFMLPIKKKMIWLWAVGLKARRISEPIVRIRL